MSAERKPVRPGTNAWLMLAYRHCVRTQLSGNAAAHIVAKRIYRRAQAAVASATGAASHG